MRVLAMGAVLLFVGGCADWKWPKLWGMNEGPAQLSSVELNAEERRTYMATWELDLHRSAPPVQVSDDERERLARWEPATLPLEPRTPETAAAAR